jgi:predicted  nucleic acid-binding Zn-ribbon protein
MIPIAAMMTGTIMMALLTYGLVRVFRGPVGQALGRRISGNTEHADHLEDEVIELRDAVTGLADELRETNERLDFTERLLAAHPERGHKEVDEVGVNTTGGG